MKFQSGNKLSRGGKKGNKGGRPSKAQIMEKIIEAEVARRIIEKNAEKLANHYVKRAMKSDRVLIDAIGKLMPATRQQVDVAVGAPEEFYRAIAEAKRNEKAR